MSMKKEIKRNPFIIYYELDDKTYRGYCSKNEDGSTNNDHKITHYINLPKDHNIYEMTIIKDNKGNVIYDANDKDLIEYVKAFYDDNAVLKKSKMLNNFNYTHYKSDSQACKTFYKKIEGDNLFKHEIIDIEEAIWISKCTNNALNYCKKGTYENCYSYDFSMNHPSILASKNFMIPTKKGVAMHINNIDKIEFGFYKLKVSSTDKNFEKIFKISKNDTYTHYDLMFLREIEDDISIQYKLKTCGYDDFDVDSDNCDDITYENCYLYDKECLVSGEKYFKKWYDAIKYFKKTYPKNKLIKKLTSKLWGLLTQANTKNYSMDEINENKMDIGDHRNDFMIVDYIMSSNKKKEPYYKLTSTKQPFYHNVRIKSFLSAYARKKLSYVCLENIDKVIRTHTDCVSFTEPLDEKIIKSYDNLVFEEKSSGSNIKWENVNKMTRL